MRQDGDWNQKVNAARKREMDGLEIYLKVDLKGLGIDQMRRVRKESGILESCAGCFAWETGMVNTTHDVDKSQGEDGCLLRDVHV